LPAIVTVELDIVRGVNHAHAAAADLGAALIVRDAAADPVTIGEVRGLPDGAVERRGSAVVGSEKPFDFVAERRVGGTGSIEIRTPLFRRKVEGVMESIAVHWSASRIHPGIGVLCYP
jgi:hypothetical protein